MSANRSAPVSMRNRLLVVAAGVLAAACGGGTARPPDPGRTGPYAVGYASYRLVDASRAGDGKTFVFRPVPVQVWYPVDPATVRSGVPEASYALDPFYEQLPATPSSIWEAHGVDRAWQEPRPAAGGPFPLVVFSHGYGVPSHGFGLATRLASHGFVFVQVHHFGEPTFLPWYPPPNGFRRNFLERPRDVRLVLDDLLARNDAPGNPLHGLVDPERIAAAGFSMGGYTVMALAGGDDDVCDIPETPMSSGFGPPEPGDPCGQATAPDPRFKAIVPIDGSNQVLHAGELRRVSVPVLGIGEDWDSIGRSDPGASSWQARQHALFSGRPAYRVDVARTNHGGSFGEGCPSLSVLRDAAPSLDADGTISGMIAALCTDVTPWSEVRDVVGTYVVAFLKTHLAGQRGYERILTPEWTVANEPLAGFFTHERIPAAEITSEWPGDETYFAHPSDVP